MKLKNIHFWSEIRLDEILDADKGTNSSVSSRILRFLNIRTFLAKIDESSKKNLIRIILFVRYST